MGLALVQRINAGLAKKNFPGEPHASPLGAQSYTMGLDHLDEFHGDVKVLNEALKIFRTGDSRPFLLAGVAALLLAAAPEDDGTVQAESLAIVLSWLERAQEDEPDRPEINFLEARVYLESGELENARVVLDYLMAQAPYEFQVVLTEAMYWEAMGNIEEMTRWYEAASKYADTVPKRVRLYEKVGDAYLAAGRLEEALEQFRQATHFSNQNGRLWHKQSLVYLEMDNIEECKFTNAQALKFGWEAAEEIRHQLRRRMGTTAFLRRIIGSE